MSASSQDVVPSKRRSWFRSVPFQIAVACGVSFTAPGMWDALGGLGAGGAAEPFAVSAANALVYVLFAIVCAAAGAINNRIGLNYGLALGAIGYPLYGAGLYTNSTGTNTWFLPLAQPCAVSALVSSGQPKLPSSSATHHPRTELSTSPSGKQPKPRAQS